MCQHWFNAFDCPQPHLKVNLTKDIWYMNNYECLHYLSAMFCSCMIQVRSVWGDIPIFVRRKWRNLAERLILHTSPGSDSLGRVQRGLGSLPLSLTTWLWFLTPLWQTIFTHWSGYGRESATSTTTERLSMQQRVKSEALLALVPHTGPTHGPFPFGIVFLSLLRSLLISGGLRFFSCSPFGSLFFQPLTPILNCASIVGHDAWRSPWFGCEALHQPLRRCFSGRAAAPASAQKLPLFDNFRLLLSSIPNQPLSPGLLNHGKHEQRHRHGPRPAFAGRVIEIFE